jgi:hypothetical protein
MGSSLGKTEHPHDIGQQMPYTLPFLPRPPGLRQDQALKAIPAMSGNMLYRTASLVSIHAGAISSRRFELY